MLSLVIALAATAATIPQAVSQGNLAEAAHAIEAGRLDQARTMIARAVAAGASGETVERLIADLESASGKCGQAVPRYEQLLRAYPTDSDLAESAGIASLKCGNIDRAAALLKIATAGKDATAAAWNARGVAADYRGDWEDSEKFYRRAASLNPENPKVLNNLGWSLMLQHRWADALEPLERAHALDPNSRRIADNLELARAAVANSLPTRRPGETTDSWSSRLNDAGVVAQAQGQRDKAIAAFSRAIEVRTEWFERAANNLKKVEAKGSGPRLQTAGK